MIDSNSAPDLFGADVHDNDGDKIGSVGQVYLDSETGEPSWVTIRTGLFGTSETFAPLSSATWADGVLQVPFEKGFVKDAPRVDADGALEPSDEDALYSYYGGARNAATAPAGSDVSGPNTDDAMTLSEERLHVGTERVETGRARLRKYVVTENQTVTVPVSHEEVTLTREPITSANIGDAIDGPAISEEEHEVILTGERVITNKETVPVERVQLGTETITEHQTVSDEVRKEEVELIDADADATQRTSN